MRQIIPLYCVVLSSLLSCKVDTKKEKSAEQSVIEMPQVGTNLPTMSGSASNGKFNALFEIAGIYKFNDEVSACFLVLEIAEGKEHYTYKLKTPARNLAGNISLKPGEDKDGYYITIDGIAWAENLGALDDEGSPVQEDVGIPQGLEGYLRENSIVIQNYGNSMNYYLQLGECDTKYIELEKVTD